MASQKSIFEFKKCRDFLEERLSSAFAKRGEKTALAKAIQIQPTYLSQVLNGTAHLSLEQAAAMNEYFAHSQEESHFVLLMVQKDRAGTPALRKYFQDQMTEVLNRRLVLTKRLGTQNSLSDEDKSTYYSSWIYSAIHIAVTIPHLRQKSALSEFLGISIKRLNEALEFLTTRGLISFQGVEIHPGTNFIRLGNDSHNIIKHHTNWRQQSIESLDRERPTDLHYSGVVSLSAEDALRIKNILLDNLKENIEIIKDSKEEELFCYCMDFFSLNKKAE